jgi:threonine dehydrogenase-like Zn-dependent dehydrogenase
MEVTLSGEARSRRSKKQRRTVRSEVDFWPRLPPWRLRHSDTMPGDLVAVVGIGGLGHLGVQFANKFGYKVAAIGRGAENAALATKLGASVYIDSKATNAAEELQKLGGTQAVATWQRVRTCRFLQCSNAASGRKPREGARQGRAKQSTGEDSVAAA